MGAIRRKLAKKYRMQAQAIRQLTFCEKKFLSTEKDTKCLICVGKTLKMYTLFYRILAKNSLQKGQSYHDR